MFSKFRFCFICVILFFSCRVIISERKKIPYVKPPFKEFLKFSIIRGKAETDDFVFYFKISKLAPDTFHLFVWGFMFSNDFVVNVAQLKSYSDFLYNLVLWSYGKIEPKQVKKTDFIRLVFDDNFEINSYFDGRYVNYFTKNETLRVDFLEFRKLYYAGGSGGVWIEISQKR